MRHKSTRRQDEGGTQAESNHACCQPTHRVVYVVVPLSIGSIALMMMESLMSCTGAAEDTEQVGCAEQLEQQAFMQPLSAAQGPAGCRQSSCKRGQEGGPGPSTADTVPAPATPLPAGHWTRPAPPLHPQTPHR